METRRIHTALRRVLTLALFLALWLTLFSAAEAWAAETTMTFTFARNGNNDYTPYIVYNSRRYQLSTDEVWKTGTATCDGLSISITGNNLYIGEITDNLYGVMGCPSYSFSHPSKYITHVKVIQNTNLETKEYDNKAQSCTIQGMYVTRIEVTLSDTKPVSTYNISYELNGGVNAATNPATYRDDAGTPLAAPVRTGYSFGGWYDNEGLNGSPIAGIPAGSSGDVTLYAKWTINRYTLTFDANGGSAVASITQNYGAALTAPANPTRTGYTFGGWSPALPDTMPAANCAFTALWMPIQYRVSFDANGGAGSMGTQNFTYDYSSFLKPNAFARQGYRFTGWNTAADGSGMSCQDGQSVHNLTAENGATVTLYAQWAVNQYTMTFDSNGGSAVAPITQDYGTALSAPAAPTRTGYTFGGWQPALPETIPAENRTFTAHWRENAYGVRFDANGGEGADMDIADYCYDTPAPLPANTYTREGYVFTGWNTAADGSGTACQDGQEVRGLAAGDGDVVTLYAQWRPITYAVHFEPGIPVNGEMTDQVLTYDQAANLTANGFSTTIGEFVSWNTNADGSGTEYADQAEMLNLSAVEGDTVTLYAQWHLSHHIRYDLDVFSCAVNGNEREKYWAYEGDTVTVSIVDHSREYTVSVVSASGSDLDFDAGSMTFIMPDEEVFITYESRNKIAYTNILLDDFESWADVAYLYDESHPIVTPAVTVQDYEGNALTEGVDYTVEITGNSGSPSRAVTATVTVTGMGGYIGINEKTFRITPFNIANCEVRGNLEIIDDGYGGLYPLMEKVQVWNGNVQLKGETLNDSSNVDFTVEIDYPESYYETYQLVPGEYNAHVKGCGDWTGEKAFTFTVIEPRHTVVFDANGGTGNMADDIATKGQQYDLPACGFTAPEGMTFDHWIADCEPDAEKQPGDYFTAPYIWNESDMQTITVTAYWTELPRHAISISDTAHGTVIVEMQTAWAGQYVALDVQPEPGYALDTLTVKQGETNVTVTDNAFVMPDGAVTVTAAFAPVAYSITVTDNLGGVLTASAATAHVGDTVTLFLPDGPYVLESLTVMQGSTPVAVDRNSFIMPAGNVQVNAILGQRLELIKRWSDYSHSSIELISGFVSDGGGYYATAGDTVSFRVVPEPGYDTVSSVSLTDYDEERRVAVTDLGGNMYSFVMPDYDVYLYAECTNIRVEIPTGHGAVTVEPTNPAEGETVTLTVVPDAGYMVAPQEPYGWPVLIRTAYGEELWPQPFWDEERMEPVFYKFTFTMPFSGATVTAAFEEAEYGINIIYACDVLYSDYDSIIVAVNGETEEYPYPAKPGDAVTLTVTPAAGFELVGITVNYRDYTDALQPVAATRDESDPLVWHFTMPDGWTTVEARFRNLPVATFGTPDFTLPVALQGIEANAFEGAAMAIVYVPDTCTEIGAEAFKDTGLTQIRLPQNCAIDSTAFTGCGTVYVFAPAGGTTEDWCQNRANIVFIAE